VTIAVPNLRDVGGVTGLDGATVRTGRLLRSALPAASDVTPEGTPWPPALVLDLRSPAEWQDADHPLAPLGARVRSLPLLESLRPDWYADATLVSLYGLVLDDASALLVDLVGEVAACEGPALVHCAAGKDRTGIAAALVLRLLGASHDDVVADYLLTEAAQDEIDARLRPQRAARSGVHPSFYAVPREAIELVLGRWDAHPGGVERWFLDAGGDPSTLARLRDTMLD